MSYDLTWGDYVSHYFLPIHWIPLFQRDPCLDIRSQLSEALQVLFGALETAAKWWHTRIGMEGNINIGKIVSRIQPSNPSDSVGIPIHPSRTLHQLIEGWCQWCLLKKLSDRYNLQALAIVASALSIDFPAGHLYLWKGEVVGFFFGVFLGASFVPCMTYLNFVKSQTKWAIEVVCYDHFEIWRLKNSYIDPHQLVEVDRSCEHDWPTLSNSTVDRQLKGAVSGIVVDFWKKGSKQRQLKVNPTAQRWEPTFTSQVACSVSWYHDWSIEINRSCCHISGNFRVLLSLKSSTLVVKLCWLPWCWKAKVSCCSLRALESYDLSDSSVEIMYTVS